MKTEKKACDYEWNIKPYGLDSPLITDDILKALPEPYSMEDTPIEERLVYAVFFIPGWNFYLLEMVDLEEGFFFGYTHNVSEPYFSEFGTSSIKELASIKKPCDIIDHKTGELVATLVETVSRVEGWTPTKIKDIEGLPFNERKKA